MDYLGLDLNIVIPTTSTQRKQHQTKNIMNILYNKLYYKDLLYYATSEYYNISNHLKWDICFSKLFMLSSG